VKQSTSEFEDVQAAGSGGTLVSTGPKLSDLGLFMKKFFKKGLTISSIVPSSPALVNMVVGNVDFSRPATIVEVGAGTGAITELIAERLRPHHRFVACENDADFCRVLHRRFPGIPLIPGDVGDIAGPLASMGIKKVDYVLSGLPTPNLPKRSLMRMMNWLRDSLSENGLFVQITEVPYYFQRFYDRFFENVEFQMVLMNIPPGGVYRCSHPRRRIDTPNISACAI